MIDRIGSVRIVEEIGSGGMAVIYKAVQESLNRTVAVKALKSAVGKDQQFVTRFEREAMSVSSLQHENIIHIYDFQRSGEDLFIVMEFVDGIDLYDLLEKCAQLPADAAAIIGMQVARALDYAHFRGIIHRDIKPANIMVGKSGTVKLMDFGIARDESFGDLTIEGTGLGTPSYMSPEQIVGNKLDFRSDMFSLGIVLYQMVAGRKPFIEDEQKGVMHKIRLEKPTPLRKLNPSVPRELERIIMKCLAKKKEDRFRSTQDLILQLERFLAKVVDINYHARLVLFLRNLGIVSTEEADAQLHPAVAGGYRKPSLESRIGYSGLRTLLAGQLAILISMTVGVLFVHASPLGTPPIQSATPTARPFGNLHVFVDPWADVYVDGTYADTTPFAKPLGVTEGDHRVELRNPFFKIVERSVSIKKGVDSELRVKLERK